LLIPLLRYVRLVRPPRSTVEAVEERAAIAENVAPWEHLDLVWIKFQVSIWVNFLPLLTRE
jgi:hypothetical protein